MKISVVIPNWNGGKYIGRCLDSLYNQTLKPDEIIVVDNGSSDNSKNLIIQRFPQTKLILLSKNYGFAGGVNIGIKKAKGNLVALLNNDAVADPDWLKALYQKALHNSNVAIFTSKVLNSRKTARGYQIDSTGDFYSSWGLPFPRGRGRLDKGQYDLSTEVFAASGAASIYRSQLFKKIGLFDPNFFAYYEDVDLSFRARLAGYKVLYVPEAIIYHQIGATSGGGKTAFSRYHSVKNSWFLYLKNLPGKLFWKNLPKFIFIQAMLLASSVKNGLLLAHARAIFTAIIKTPYELIQRRRVQRTRIISVEQVEKLLEKNMPPIQKKRLKKFKIFF